MRFDSGRTRFVLASVIALGVTRVVLAQREVTPNDPYFKDQISFRNSGGGIDLNITKAWSITTGSKNVIVAILDDGFCYLHPDLRENIWHNPGESGMDVNGHEKEANGIDDDQNGYVDDVVGWDFVFETPDVDCHIFDGMDRNRIAPYWHSMGAMGIIGAKSNNGIGVAGINWDVSMMLLRIGVQGIQRGEIDTSRIDRVARAIHYAVDNGARIINWSGFVDDIRPEKLAKLHEAISYAAKKNVLIVVCAGNDAKNLDNDKNCVHPPQCFDSENLIKVGEVDFEGNLYVAKGKFIGGSNYGVRRVQIAAVGMSYTTGVTKGGGFTYQLTGGTSGAGVWCSGADAVGQPGLNNVTTETDPLGHCKALAPLAGKIQSGGIVDAYAAVKAARETKK